MGVGAMAVSTISVLTGSAVDGASSVLSRGKLQALSRNTIARVIIRTIRYINTS
jgi:hypothetical protein